MADSAAILTLRMIAATFTSHARPDVPTFDRSTGGLAQLGERLNGIQKVVGSSPISSTPQAPAKQGLVSFLASATGTAGD